MEFVLRLVTLSNVHAILHIVVKLVNNKILAFLIRKFRISRLILDKNLNFRNFKMH